MAEAFSASPWHDGFDAWLAAVVNHWTDGNDTRNWHSGDRLAATEAEGATDFGHLHLAGGSAGLKGLRVLPAGFAHRCARSPWREGVRSAVAGSQPPPIRMFPTGHRQRLMFSWAGDT